MRLDRLTPGLMRRAMKLYLELAYPPGPAPRSSSWRPPVDVSKFEEDRTVEEILDRFERPSKRETPACARYTLRLGNARYPFMKFVVQEYLVQEEYFFSVDTHDDLKITPDMPDYDGWQDVLRHNRKLKTEVETAWAAARMPTHEDLCTLMRNIAELEREDSKRARLLVVDDERDVARGLGAALEARGYEVELAFDGRMVLDSLAKDPLPDMVLLDYSMPELNGDEVIERLRSSERCRNLPILLATASNIDLSLMTRSCGLLRKPYPREVLFAMITQLLNRERAEGEESEGNVADSSAHGGGQSGTSGLGDGDAADLNAGAS